MSVNSRTKMVLASVIAQLTSLLLGWWGLYELAKLGNEQFFFFFNLKFIRVEENQQMRLNMI